MSDVEGPTPRSAGRPEKPARNAARSAARAAARGAARDAADAAARDAAETGAPSQDEMTVAFTPKQLFTGFAIIAGLVLLARRRGRRAGRDVPRNSGEG